MHMHGKITYDAISLFIDLLAMEWNGIECICSIKTKQDNLKDIYLLSWDMVFLIYACMSALYISIFRYMNQTY